MKKIYTLIVLALPFLFNTANAQSKLAAGAIAPVPVSTLTEKGGNSVMVIDTMKPASFTSTCFTSDPTPLVYYNLGAAGYLAGTNSYGETECAQRYPFTGSGTISQILVRYGKHSGTTGTTSAIIYDADPTTKRPTTVKGTSSVVLLSAIPATGYTPYTFATAVTVTADFVVSCVLPTTSATGDSVVVVSTKEGCSTDSLSYLNIAQFGGWNSVASLVNGGGAADTSLDLLIRPVVVIAAGINELPSMNGLTLMGASPNPANDFTNIQYHIDAPGLVSVEIFDLSGRVIQNTSEKLSAGNHEIKVSLKDIAAGNYYYTVKTEGANLTSKFVVTK
jgi:hypothetical protein